MRSYMKSGKPGMKSVMPSAKGSNFAHNSGGMGGYSCEQKPIPGPESSGPPASMRNALTKKSRPDKGTSFPGSVR